MRYMRDAVQQGWLPNSLPTGGGMPAVVVALDSQHHGTAGQTVSAALLGQALDTVSEGSLITDAEQNVVYTNKAFEAVTGYSPAEMLGRNCRVLQGAGSDRETIAMMKAVLGRGDTFRCEILNYRKNGTPFWNGLTVSPLKDANGVITHFVSVQRDITAQKTLQDQLRFLALHDPVTRLPNRTALDQYLSRNSGPSSTLTAIGIIDLDDFKDVNDAHGHAAGDALLIEYARRLRRKVRSQDFLARMGGDEFVVIITGLSPLKAEEELQQIMARLHEAVDADYSVGPGARVRVSMSMGLTLCSPGEGAGSLALRRADAVLYQQKARKTDRHTWWSLGRHEAANGYRETLAAGREAATEARSTATVRPVDGGSTGQAQEYRKRLFDGGLRMYFQPIMDLRTNEVHCLEALTRLVLPDGSVLPAPAFLPLLNPEEMESLLRAGLDEVLSQLTVWDALGVHVNVSVNVPPSALTNPEMVQWVASALESHGVPPDRLTLELPESDAGEDSVHGTIIQQLLDLGVSMALDNLGIGQNTLLDLAMLPFNTVKIDRKFLLQLKTSPLKTMTFLTNMIGMGKDMGWALVAEGLEDASLTEAMRILGVPYGQGFHLARPMAAEKIPAWIAAAGTSNGHDSITEFTGALAYHWQFNRLKTPHTGPLAACPLTPFLAGHPAAVAPADLHRTLHAGTSHNPGACDELLRWLESQVVTGAGDSVPSGRLQPPALARSAAVVHATAST